MENTYWQKQTADKPLFPDLLWSRPENKQARGKLLIIGGNAHGFAVPAQAYGEALKAGIGTARVLLPDALQKTVGSVFEVAEYAPSTSSGSFKQAALDQMLDLGQWADGVLITGELGRNAETAALMEKFVTKSGSMVTVTRDAVNAFNSSPQTILDRQKTTLVLSLAQLQKLAKEVKFISPVTFDMDILHLVDWLHKFTEQFACHIVVKHLDNIFVASKGQVSSTKLESDIKIWRVTTAAHAAVWWLQNTSKPFEALTTAVFTR